MVPVWLFPVEVTLGGTVVPPENPQKKCCRRRRQSVRWLCSIRTQRLLHTCCRSEITFCSAIFLNQITYLMNKMWFHSKSNIPISQIQYRRQYQPILEVNRWSVNNMSVHRVKNSCYWYGWWCDWQRAVETVVKCWLRKASRYEVIVETCRLNTARYSPLCFRWLCRFWRAPPKSKHTTHFPFFTKNTCSLARRGHFLNTITEKQLIHTKPAIVQNTVAKTPACLNDNINNENPPQPVISAHIGVLFKATDSLCFRSSHRAEHMFLPKGLRVLNCHPCILCGTKGAYVRTEQWIKVSARETETKREKQIIL